MKHRIPFRDRILCSPAEAGEVLDKGKTAIFAMIAEGKLRSRKDGARRHVYVESVLEAAGVRDGSRGTDLAEYLSDCLAAWDRAVNAREKWYGRVPEQLSGPIPIQKAPTP